MLSELQEHLVEINQADPGYKVRDFLITDPALAGILGKGSLVPDTSETVLLSADDDGLSVSVFIEDALLQRLEGHDPFQRLQARRLADLWTVIEGISHFNYIAWCASRDKSLTLFELEMQAEVDKFAGIWFLALSQRDRDLADRIHGWLFDRVTFNSCLNNEQRARYESANAIAARYCYGLRKRWHKDNSNAVRELRRFYRLGQAEKISHIHGQAWYD
jgi:hypothetical protein